MAVNFTDSVYWAVSANVPVRQNIVCKLFRQDDPGSLLASRFDMVDKMEARRRHLFSNMAPIDPGLPGTRRRFLASWPDYASRGQITDHARQWSLLERCMQCAPADQHVALHFSGSMPAERLPAVPDGVDVQPDPFEVVLNLETAVDRLTSAGSAFEHWTS